MKNIFTYLEGIKTAKEARQEAERCQAFGDLKGAQWWAFEAHKLERDEFLQAQDERKPEVECEIAF